MHHRPSQTGWLILFLFQATGAAGSIEARFPVEIADHYGYIDPTGTVVLPPQYVYAGIFYEELALAAIEVEVQPGDFHRKYGFIDPEGNWVVRPEYDLAFGFSGGFAPVCSAGRWGYIDRQGRITVPLQYILALPVAESRGLVITEYSWEKSIYTLQGAGINHAAVIDFRDRSVHPLPESWFIAPSLDYKSYRGGKPNRRCAFAQIELPVYAMKKVTFSCGFLPIRINDKQLRFVDENYQLSATAANSSCTYRPFQENLSLIIDPMGHSGYARTNGQTQIPLKFAKAKDFSAGLAGAKLPGGQYGFIDQQGQFVIPPAYEDVASFHEGLCAVRLDGLWGFIDGDGKQVIPCRFSAVTYFNQGLAYASTQTETGYINRQGQFVWKAAEREIFITSP